MKNPVPDYPRFLPGDFFCMYIRTCVPPAKQINSTTPAYKSFSGYYLGFFYMVLPLFACKLISRPNQLRYRR